MLQGRSSPSAKRLLAVVAVLVAAASAFLAGALLSVPDDARVLRCPRHWAPVNGLPCREVSGRVLHVWAKDSDGDGDMHLVLLSRQSVTFPGVSIVKLRPDRRPRRPPAFGTWVSALGGVAVGGHGRPELYARDVVIGR